MRSGCFPRLLVCTPRVHGACRAELCLRSALRSKTIWKAIDDTKVRPSLLHDTARAHSMYHSRHWFTPHVAFVRHQDRVRHYCVLLERLRGSPPRFPDHTG